MKSQVTTNSRREMNPVKLPSNEQKTNDEKSNSDTPPNDSSQQVNLLQLKTTNNRKKIKRQEEQQPSPAEKHTSDADTASSGDSQPTPDS